MTIPLIALLAGVIIGAAIMWMMINCCCQKSCSKDPAVTDNLDSLGVLAIDTIAANNYFKAYYSNATPVILKGFTISLKQFSAMKSIAAGDASIGGFRVYLGMNGQAEVRMVVGTGSPDKVQKIYLTDGVGSGPCPNVCDVESPIIKD